MKIEVRDKRDPGKSHSSWSENSSSMLKALMNIRLAGAPLMKWAPLPPADWFVKHTAAPFLFLLSRLNWVDIMSDRKLRSFDLFYFFHLLQHYTRMFFMLQIWSYATRKHASQTFYWLFHVQGSAWCFCMIGYDHKCSCPWKHRSKSDSHKYRTGRNVGCGISENNSESVHCHIS